MIVVFVDVPLGFCLFHCHLIDFLHFLLLVLRHPCLDRSCCCCCSNWKPIEKAYRTTERTFLWNHHSSIGCANYQLISPNLRALFLGMDWESRVSLKQWIDAFRYCAGVWYVCETQKLELGVLHRTRLITCKLFFILCTGFQTIINGRLGGPLCKDLEEVSCISTFICQGVSKRESRHLSKREQMIDGPPEEYTNILCRSSNNPSSPKKCYRRWPWLAHAYWLAFRGSSRRRRMLR